MIPHRYRFWEAIARRFLSFFLEKLDMAAVWERESPPT
jgi:hypothetical protein